MERYTCNLGGVCEPDPNGSQTLEECKDNCQGLEGGQDAKEIAYMTLALIPGDAYRLSPSDQVEVVKRITGVRPTKSLAPMVLKALATNDILHLWGNYAFSGEGQQIMREYLQDAYNLDTLDHFILDALIDIDIQYQIPYDWQVLRQHVEWNIQDVFSGRSGALIEELVNEPVSSYQNLVEVIQRHVFTIPLDLVEKDYNYTENYVRVLLPYWDWILETYGPVLPHEDLIQG